MEAIVKLSDDLKEKAGTGTIKVPINEGETVDTLLMKLSRRYPKLIETILDPTTGEVKGNYEVSLNGRRIRYIRGIHTKLKHKDEVAISRCESEMGKKLATPQTAPFTMFFIICRSL
jgi:molybdopterin converting factor small subunit